MARRHGRRIGRWIGFLALLYVGLVIVVLGVYAVTLFKQSEAKIAKFCGETLVGMSLTDVERTARDLGLDTKRNEQQGTATPTLSAFPVGTMLSGASFCTIEHDGTTVTGVIHQPWYH